MTDLAEARRELALANNIVANEGVLDAFGHVSMRHPDHPDRYLLSRSRAPELVTADDLIEYDLDSRPLRDPGVPQYSERVIHGEIYKARPDVMSVCHHHAPAFMPLLATATDYHADLPSRIGRRHQAAVLGSARRIRRYQFAGGETPAEGASLARALGTHWMVLMNRHGVDRRRHQRARLRVPLRSIRAQCRIPGAAPWHSAPSPHCRRAKSSCAPGSPPAPPA